MAKERKVATKNKVHDERKDQIVLRRTDPMQIFCMRPEEVARIKTDGKVQVLAEHTDFMSVEIYNAPSFVILERKGEREVYSSHSKDWLLGNEAFVSAYFGDCSE